MACFPKSSTSGATWPKVWDNLRWSFHRIAPRLWPVWQTLRVQCSMWLETWNLFQHITPPTLGCRVALLGLWHPQEQFQGIELRKSQLCQCKGPASDHPLFTLPGVTSRNVRFNMLHVLFHPNLKGCTDAKALEKVGGYIIGNISTSLTIVPPLLAKSWSSGLLGSNMARWARWACPQSRGWEALLPARFHLLWPSLAQVLEPFQFPSLTGSPSAFYFLWPGILHPLSQGYPLSQGFTLVQGFTLITRISLIPRVHPYHKDIPYPKGSPLSQGYPLFQGFTLITRISLIPRAHPYHNDIPYLKGSPLSQGFPFFEGLPTPWKTLRLNRKGCKEQVCQQLELVLP